MPCPRAVIIVIGLLLVTSGVSGVSAAQPGETRPAVGLQQAGLQESFDRVEFRIAVFANGSARWTFHYERVVGNQTEREQFEAFAESFTANDTRLFSDFRNQSQTLVERGETTTGREMDADKHARRAFVTTQLNEVGVVEMAFTWHGFALVDGERVIVGDVFEDGLYIAPDQALVVRAGDGLAFQSAEPAAITSAETLETSETVTWQGELTFPDRHPRVLFGPVDGGAMGTDSGSNGLTTTGIGGTDPRSSLWPVGLVLAVIVAALGVFMYRRRSGESIVDRDSSGPDATAFDELALLDDEERITRLLREHGGRMRQSAIVEATGWSKSKVSMVLSEMAESDAVRKLRVGRENIISLPGHEPEAARSPHEDLE